MKYSEFRKWLEKQGAVFRPHKSGSSHFRVTLNNKMTIFPFHGSKEIGTGLINKIKKI
ncbi:type II toxin-antitoxin system HicA family toxin [Pelistega suis]|uniref:Type II toxin-antitoxin system HicA family toxin n=1 Tax=Pelistega suis TaxID=1631957 RepID=A0A849P432_9BURK|nr:type II toxin-antitoxin system HicA family toxin [Pelistega suis]